MLSDVNRAYPRVDSTETMRGVSTAYVNRNPNLLRKMTDLRLTTQGVLPITGE